MSGVTRDSNRRLWALDDSACLTLAAQGTPAFGYRLSVARERFAALRRAMPERVRLAYAVKANPGRPLLQELARLGAWFDCASAGEVGAVSAAIRAVGNGALPPSGIVFAGPGKSDADLRAAHAAGARVQVDGPEDVERLAAMHHGPGPLPISVRVHPATGFTEANPIIGGAGPSAFGVDEEDLTGFVAACAAHPQVRLTGLQVFAASNELDADALLANHAAALQIGRRLQEDLGVHLDLIDLGGGLGIPYSPEEPELDTGRLGTGLDRLLQHNSWFSGRLLLEPGRWIAGPTGIYLTRVVRVKPSRGQTFAVLEGGINHLLRPLLTGQPFPVRVVRPDAPEHDERTTYTLTGPLCTSLDRLGTLQLPELTPGDLLSFGQAGAYAATQAMTHFLSHPVPTQHWM